MVLFSSRQRSSQATPPRRRSSQNDTKQTGDERRRELKSLSARYKRGYTMAGSTGPRIKAADPRALGNATPREKVHHLTRVRRHLTALLVGLAIVIIALFGFLQQYTATIAVQFSDASLPDGGGYGPVIQEYLNQNPLERLRFNIDKDKLNQYMTSQRPEIEQITVNGFAGPAESAFTITLRKPVVSWQIDDRLYYVDEHGVSFSKNVYTQPTVKIIDNSGVRYTPGTAIASERFLGFVGKAVALAKSNSISVTQVIIPTGTSRQVQLSVDGYGYPVILSIDRSVGEQVEDMARTLNFFKGQGRSPQYVDLRVKGKVFFRE